MRRTGAMGEPIEFQRVPSLPGFRIECVFQPAGAVGGDVGRIVRIGEDHVGLFVADVSGKGARAALIAARVMELIDGPARNFLSPKDALIAINDELRGKIPDKDFVTALYGVLDISSSRITLTNCGHLPPWFYSASEARSSRPELKGTVLGRVPSSLLQRSLYEQSMDLRPGDRLLLCSDGLSEAMNTRGEEYGEQRLGEVFDRLTPSQAGFLDPLLRDLSAFLQGAPPQDDLTAMILSRPTADPLAAAPDLPAATLDTAFADPLTGLPDELALESWPVPHLYSILALDVDSFSQLFRGRDPAHSEAALRSIADRMKEILGSEAILGRRGGDEFFAVLPHRGRADAWRAANLLAACLRETPPPCRVSIGLAVYPEDGINLKRVLARARDSMAVAKRLGGGRIVADPLEHYAVATECAAVRELVFPALAGRRDEMETLEQAVEDARDGRPRLVLVKGDPGVGVSRLLEETVRAAQTFRMGHVTLACAPEWTVEPYGLASRILRDLSLRFPGANARIWGRLPPETAGILANAFPDLATTGSIPVPELDPGKFAEELFLSVGRALMAWSRALGLCVCVENFMYADRASLELIRWLLRAAGFRCVFVCGLPGDWSLRASASSPIGSFLKEMHGHKSFWELDLSALSLAEVESFFRGNYLDVRPADRVPRAALYMTGGLPIRLTALLRRWLQRRVMVPAGMQWNVALAESEEPNLLQGSMEFDNPDFADALRFAAVAGPSFDPKLMADALGWHGPHAFDVLERLEEAGLFRLDPETRKVGFASESLRSLLYRRLPPETRQALHRRIAELRVDRPSRESLARIAFAVAHHLESAGDEERARQFRGQAARLVAPHFQDDVVPRLRNLRPKERLAAIPECDRALDLPALAAGQNAVRRLVTALKMRQTYADGSPALEQAVTQFHQDLRAVLQRVPAFTISHASGGLSLNRMAASWPASDPAGVLLAGILEERRIRSLTVTAGIDRAEVAGLVSLFGTAVDAEQLAAREDYWESRIERQGLTHVGIISVEAVEEEAAISEARRKIASDAREFLEAFRNAVEAARIHPRRSPPVQERVAAMHRHLSALLEGTGGVSLALGEKDLFLNGVTVDPSRFPASQAIVALLQAKEVTNLSFSKKVEEKEIAGFLDLLGPSGPRGEQGLGVALTLNGVREITVGLRAPRYKDPSLASVLSGEEDPVQRIQAMLKEPDEMFERPREGFRLFPLIKAVATARRPDLIRRLLRRLVQILEQKEFPDRRRVAARWIAEAVLHDDAALRKLAAAAVQEGVKNALRGELEREVFDTLAPTAVPLVSEGIADGDWESVAELLQALLAHGEDRLERVLVELETLRLLGPVFEAFESEESRLRVEPVVRLLGGRAVDPLAGLIRRSANPRTREAAAVALRAIRPEAWKRVAVGISARASPAECRRFLEALPLLLDDVSPAAPVLVELAGSSDPAVVTAVLELSNRLPPRPATELVNRVLRRPESDLVVTAIRVATLSRLEGPAGVVLQLLKRRWDDRVGIACCQYFGAVPHPLVLDDLVQMSGAKKGLWGGRPSISTELRAAAALAIGSFSTQAAREAVEILLRDSDPAVQAAASRAAERLAALPGGFENR